MKSTRIFLFIWLLSAPLIAVKAADNYVELIEREKILQAQLRENLAKQKLKADTIFTWQTFTFQSTLDTEHQRLLEEIEQVKIKKRNYEQSVEEVMKRDSADAIDQLVLQKPLRPNKKRFVFVNGRLNAAQNYVSFDRTAVALNRHVFEDNLIVLSARGKESPVMVPNEDMNDVVREPSGEATSFVWQPEDDVPIQPATKGNFDAIIDQVKEEEAKELTMFFYDHGSEDGVGFWYHDVNQEHLSSQYSKLGKDTIIRAVHFHCHSEHAISDMDRVIPKENDAMAEFIKKHYPKNYCAVGASRADEVARNPSDTYNNDESNYFVKIAKYSAPFTLDKIRERIHIDWSLPSTPVLTSDLLLEDINKFVCQKLENNQTEELFEGCEKNQADAQPASRGPNNSLQSYKVIFDQLCGNHIVRNIDHLTNQLDDLEEKGEKLRKELMGYRKDYLELTNPELHNKVQAYYKEQDRLLGLLALAEEPEKLEPLVRYSLIKSRESMGLEKYHNTLLHDIDLDSNLGFRKYVQSRTHVPYLEQESDRISSLKKSKNRQRKEQQNLLRVQRQKLAAQLFELPIFQDAKETYEQVRKCETSPLD